MDVASVLPLVVLALGFYMAWNIGANDVSNAMGTSVGSGALTLKKAVLLAAILEFSGAYFVGSNVSETMQKGIIDIELFFPQPNILIAGMCAALLGTGIWLQIASYFGWPVSTTHAIVGALLGFGGVVGGSSSIHWNEVGLIAASWIVSPASSALFSYIIFSILQRNILFAMNPVEATKTLMPLLVFIVFSTFTLSLIFNGLKHLDFFLTFPQALGIAFLVGLLCSLFSFFIIRRLKLPAETMQPPSRYLPQTVISLNKAIKHLGRVHANSFDETQQKISSLLEETKTLAEKMRKESSFSERVSEYTMVEKFFVYLQIISACFVAFAHGANDVANAIGPVAAVLDTIKHGTLKGSAAIPSWLLAFGGAGIVLGLATWGWRVIETVGKKITELTPTRGFCAEFGAATTILIASKLGLPISTTHCLIGSILGVGLARGMKALNLGILRDIVLSWVITIPASAITSILLFYLFKMLFL